MYVGLKMLKMGDFATVTSDTLVSDAEKIMLDKQLWMLLVVEEGKLIGCVRKEAVKEALPSRATSLSKHELNYLLSKLKVEKVLEKDVPTVFPEADIEEAAEMMHKQNLAGLAVVDKQHHLLGYINRSIMLDVLVEEMGLKQKGSRIAFEVQDRPGVIQDASSIIAQQGISIIAMGTFYHDSRRMVVFRLKTDDPTAVLNALKEKGYQLVGPNDFAQEWKV